MAYIYKEQTTTSASDAFSKIITEMVNAGWVLYDDVAAETKVYSSVGETGTEITGYMKIYVTSDRIYFEAYLYWDNGAHTGTCQSYGPYNYITISSTQTLYIMGSKDMFFIRGSAGTGKYNMKWFGHIPSSYYTKVYTTLTAGATAGNGAILTVVDTSNFIIESEYQIVGVSEGRDMVTISSLTDGTHMVVHNLPNDYALGASIGIIPSLFGLADCLYGGVFYPICHIQGTGLAQLSSAYHWDCTYYISAGYLDPSERTDRYILQPISVTENSDRSVVGYCGANILYAPSGTQDDLFGVKAGHPVDGDVGSSGATTLTDSNKSWSINEHNGRYVVVTSGLGLGQVRSVTSNTADTLTIPNAWTTNPDATSTYSVVDEVYVKIDPFTFVFKVIAPLH